MAKTYNSIPTVATGDVYTATAHNNIVTNVNNYRVPPVCMIEQATGQSISDATNTTITFDTTRVNTDAMYPGGSSSTVTVQTDGIYLITIYNSWATTMDVRGDVWLTVNGTEVGRDIRYGTVERVGPLTFMRSLTAGNTLQVFVRQDNSANTARTAFVYFSAVWLGQVS